MTDLVSQLLLDEPVLLALPKTWQHWQDPIKLEKLKHEDWIVGSRQSDDRSLAERACAIAGFIPRIRHSVNDYVLVLRMISADLGIGLVPKLALKLPNARTVVFRALHGPQLRRCVHAITRKSLKASPMVQAFLAELIRKPGSSVRKKERPTPGRGLEFNDFKVIELSDFIRHIERENANIIVFETKVRIKHTLYAAIESARAGCWTNVNAI